MTETSHPHGHRGTVAALVATLAWVTTTFLLASVEPAAAQFGKNKVQYRSFKWRILETEHFQIHYYDQERAAAFETARMSERSYAYLAEFFDHEMVDKIPLILYSNHQDFEQSNIIAGFISEGTGGVTESLKGRVTLPLTGSFAELNHVLTHELVHAFQFDLLQRNVRGLLGIGPLHLWMVEGMAEWISNGVDPITTMWIVDAVRRDKLPEVAKMATIQDIRVYRMGQAMYEVIGQNYGKERIRRILSRRDQPPVPRTRRDSLLAPVRPFGDSEEEHTAYLADSLAFVPGSMASKSLETLWRSYADSLANVLGPGLVDPDSVAERITHGLKYGRSFHLAPALSPAGDRILYYSSRGFRNELFLAENQEGDWQSRSLATGQETPELESLPLLSASADWSYNGRQVVFVATQQGTDVIQILDVESRKIKHTLRTELLSVSNPSFSPDGRYVVFSALIGGFEDLFLVEIETQRLIRLTQDAYSERTPRFSPDGNTILFATDRGPRTDLDALQFGPWNLGLMKLVHNGRNPKAGPIEVLHESDSNEFSPVWSPEGQTVAFVSDRAGTFQVYTLDLATKEVRQRTRFDTGIVGIVATGPAISWSPSGHMAFSVFRNGGWNLYRVPSLPEESVHEEDQPLAFTRSAPSEIQEEADTQVVQEERDYKVRLTPEYAQIGALYVGNTGAAGSGRLLLGDMLGNHYLLVGGDLRSNLDESEFLIQYANLGHRWQWGTAAYQFRNDIGVITAPDSARFTSLVWRGVVGQVAYPFNLFRRIEFLVDLRTVSNEVAEVLFSTGQQVGRSRQRFYYAIPEVALVHDTSAYSGFTPIAGKRWRASIQQAVGDFQYTFGLLDWRRYFNIHGRGAFALRMVGAGSVGRDLQLLRIGGPDTYRGGDFGEFTGSRIFFSNMELRFPIIPSTEILRGIVFVDAAAAWKDNETLDLTESGGPLGFRLRDLNMAYGVGVRAFIGLPLRFDAAIPTDLERHGAWRTTFSIGLDF